MSHNFLFSFVILSAILLGISCASKANLRDRIDSTELTMQFLYAADKDSVSISVANISKGKVDLLWKEITVPIVDGMAKFYFDHKNSFMIKTYKSFYNGCWSDWILEQGDKLIIYVDRGSLRFSGNAASKFLAWYKADSLLKTVPLPKNTNQHTATSLEDFYDFIKYKDKQLDLVIPFIDSFKAMLSYYSYNTIRARFISRIEEGRLDKFSAFKYKASDFGLDNKSVANVFDSTVTSKYLTWLSESEFGEGWYALVREEVARKFNYDYDNDSLKSRELRKFLYYSHGKKKYKGLAREKFLKRLITLETMYEIGFTDQTEKLIDMYYSEPGFEEYKKYVKEYEINIRKLSSGKLAPYFSLTDTMGRVYSTEEIKGKIAIIDFWFTGCTGCVQMSPSFHKVEEAFKTDTNVLFLSISIDKDRFKWIKSISEKKYTSGSGINLYTGGKGQSHSIIKTYSINAYPTLYMIDAEGRIVNNPLPDPRDDSGKGMIQLIKNELVLLQDGPYVFHDKDASRVINLNGKSERSSKDTAKLFAGTNVLGESFKINLKNTNISEPTIWEKPSRILALSDIEGNFLALRKLLQSNHIINHEFQWVFGNGHLVFAGDMFDRGLQVTECLWLIYSLEEQARQAGGYVHFILGNHEILNLSGKTDYVRHKYLQNTQLIGLPYKDLYNSNSELGQWLRSKNVVEKIGDLLFLHGGIGPELDSLQLSLEEMNSIARPFFSKEWEARQSADVRLFMLFNSKFSPFWYRNQYLDSDLKRYPQGQVLYKPKLKEIEIILSRYNVNKIITGHTIIADTISLHYGGRIINIDTKHAAGNSEALLVEGGTYYRVDGNGKRKVLISEEKKEISRIPK